MHELMKKLRKYYFKIACILLIFIILIDWIISGFGVFIMIEILVAIFTIFQLIFKDLKEELEKMKKFHFFFGSFIIFVCLISFFGNILPKMQKQKIYAITIFNQSKTEIKENVEYSIYDSFTIMAHYNNKVDNVVIYIDDTPIVSFVKHIDGNKRWFTLDNYKFENEGVYTIRVYAATRDNDVYDAICQNFTMSIINDSLVHSVTPKPTLSATSTPILTPT